MKKPPSGKRYPLPFRLLSRLIAASLLTAPMLFAPIAAAAESAGPRFTISRYTVEGNTLLPAAFVETLLAGYAGPSRDFGDVQRAREALLEAYAQRGYTVVQVQLPEQELNAGVVRFRVVEARIGKVSVEGNKYFGEANVRRSLPGLREGVIPNLTDISASLKAANENPARQIAMKLSSSLDPNATSSTDINATLTVADERPWKLGLTADNTGNSQTGKNHVGLSYQNANLWDRDHQLTLQYTTSPQELDKVRVYGAGYHLPLYAAGDSMDFYASYSDVDSGHISLGLFDLNVSGKGTVYGARYNQKLTRRGRLDAKLTYGLEVKEFENNVTLINYQLGNDVTVRPLSISYAGTVAPGEGQPGEYTFYLTGVHNLAGGKNGGAQDFNLARLGARASYSLVRYGLGYTRGFAGDWQLRLMYNGQYSRDVLVPGEQFGAGGANSVRGFLEREISNDSGNFAGVEMYTPNLCGTSGMQCRALVFVDAAGVRRNKPLPGEMSSASIASTGLGFRIAMARNLTAQLDYGRVIEAGGSKSVGDSRVHFNVALFY